MNPPSFPGRLRRRFSRWGGSSLIGLLTAMALIGLLIGLGSISIRGSSNSLQLGTTGARCAGLLENARETAILRKTPTAVVFLSAKGKAPAALAVMEYKPDTDSWVRISKWENLPPGTISDSAVYQDYNSAVGQNSPAISPALPVLDVGENSYSPGGDTGYGYLVFLSTGALHQNHTRPGIFRLIQSIAGEANLVPTVAAKNYFEVIVNPSTGRKMIRPE